MLRYVLAFLFFVLITPFTFAQDAGGLGSEDPGQASGGVGKTNYTSNSSHDTTTEDASIGTEDPGGNVGGVGKIGKEFYTQDLDAILLSHLENLKSETELDFHVYMEVVNSNSDDLKRLFLEMILVNYGK